MTTNAWTISIIALAGLMGLSCAAIASESPEPTVSKSTSSPETGSPHDLKNQVRITVATNVVAVTVDTNAPAPKVRSFDWKAKWEGWDGLHVEISQKTPLTDPFADFRERVQGSNSYRVHLEELKMSGKIGGKLALDGAAYVTGQEFTEFDPGVEVRRARIYARGDCILVLPVSYQLEVGYIPNEFYIEESYLAFKDIPYIGELKLGQYQAPMGLDAITSTRDLALMEPALPIAALAPGVNAGVQLDRTFFNERVSWALGLFTDGVGNDFGDASKDYGRAITRITGLPIFKPAAEHLLHLGLSANVLYADSAVRYRSRPESHLAPYVVDTQEISTQGALTLGAEIAWVKGPLSIVGEYLHSFVEQSESDTLNFGGAYGSVSWFLTGESRPYDQKEGKFGRVIPTHNFNWGKGGWGAWEIAGRFSYVDLDSGSVHGGRMAMVMGGLNWYLHSHVKCRFNYGFGHVSGRSPGGNVNVFQTRVEIDF